MILQRILQAFAWTNEPANQRTSLLYYELMNFYFQLYTANMCSGITVKVHLKNCNFEKLQFFTVDFCSLYFLQVKNCNFGIIFM